MPLSLEALSAATALLVPTLPPHESHPLLYKGFCQFLQRLKESTSSQESLLAYVIFELLFLEGSGFGLDLKKCAVTEREDDLIYVSPRSGRAVCGEAGLPYAHKLLKLPPFINELKTGSPLSQFSSGLTFTDLKQALELTGYFIESHVFQPISTPIPASRDRLFQEVRKKIKK
jgi:DNA repair protein RecO (recombination protein O)